MPDEITRSFGSARELRRWLGQNHAKIDHIWLRFFKKRPGVETLTYGQALDEALCFGWIDGQLKPWDGESWIQRWGPRRPRSKWSQRNVQHAERLISAGLMTHAGLEQIEAAKADGRWHAAYPSPRDAAPPEDFMRALRKSKQAHAFYDTLNRTNIYAIVYRLHHAKRPETRERWIEKILAMLEEGRAFHPPGKSAAGHPKSPARAKVAGNKVGARIGGRRAQA